MSDTTPTAEQLAAELKAELEQNTPPPPKAEPKKRPSRARKPPPVSDADIRAGLYSYVVMGTIPLALKGDGAVAEHMQAHAEPLIESWVALGEHNKYVRAALEFLAIGGPWSVAATQTLAFTYPIMVYYGKAPQIDALSAFGVVYIPKPEREQEDNGRAVSPMVEIPTGDGMATG
jgi:hypothetical protein